MDNGFRETPTSINRKMYMDAVQRMRVKAQGTGNLKTSSAAGRTNQDRSQVGNRLFI